MFIDATVRLPDVSKRVPCLGNSIDGFKPSPPSIFMEIFYQYTIYRNSRFEG